MQSIYPSRWSVSFLRKDLKQIHNSPNNLSLKTPEFFGSEHIHSLQCFFFFFFCLCFFLFLSLSPTPTFTVLFRHCTRGLATVIDGSCHIKRFLSRRRSVRQTKTRPSHQQQQPKNKTFFVAPKTVVVAARRLAVIKSYLFLEGRLQKLQTVGEVGQHVLPRAPVARARHPGPAAVGRARRLRPASTARHCRRVIA